MWWVFFIFFSSAFANGPPLPADTVPLYIEDPVLPDHASAPSGFACYGACGASCKCVGFQASDTSTCFEGKRCHWKTISCKTHGFCRWHDGCHRSCDFQFPGNVGDGDSRRTVCYTGCNLGCITGNAAAPAGGWNPPSLDPGPLPGGGLGFSACLARLRWDPSVAYDGAIVFAELDKCVPDPDC